MDTLNASMQSLRAEDHPQPNWFAPDGQRLGDVFFRQVQKTFMEKGPRAYFDEIDRQEVHDQIGVAPMKATANIAPAPAAEAEESSLSYIGRIIAFCREHDIELRLFITPSHANQAEIATMLWGEQAVDSGKRALVKLLAEDAAHYPDRAPIPVMDFSGYSSVTTEPLPPKGRRTEMRFYWDSSHFKEIVGDYVLDRLFDIHNPARAVPADFGVALTASNLEQVLAGQKAAKAAFRKNSAQSLTALHALTPGLPVLVYHQIRTPGRQEPWDESTTISLADFEAQMRYLHDQGYTTLSMQEVMDYVHGKPFPDKIVAIHFDDGWKSAQEAVPVLNRYGFKVSFWIIAGAGHDIGSPHMDWDAIMALAKNPHFDIYSHTMTHPWKEGATLLDWIKDRTSGKGIQQAGWELTESKRILEEKLGHEVPYLAWPRGLYNDTLISLARKAGYRALLTIDDGFNHPGDDPYYIRRIMIDGRCDFSAFSQALAHGTSPDCAPDANE
jgi:peptidoglycan/xylan/chitin deacetylase (PgdA/CDA1 family)